MIEVSKKKVTVTRFYAVVQDDPDTAKDKKTYKSMRGLIKGSSWRIWQQRKDRLWYGLWHWDSRRHYKTIKEYSEAAKAEAFNQINAIARAEFDIDYDVYGRKIHCVNCGRYFYSFEVDANHCEDGEASWVEYEPHKKCCDEYSLGRDDRMSREDMGEIGR